LSSFRNVLAVYFFWVAATWLLGKAAPSAPDISLIMAAAVVTLGLLWPAFRWRKGEKHA